MKKRTYDACGGSTTAGLSNVENATDLMRMLLMGG